MMKKIIKIACIFVSSTVLFSASVLTVSEALAEDGVVKASGSKPAKKTKTRGRSMGDEAADDYFKKRKRAPKRRRASRGTASSGDRYMHLHVGTFVSQDSYRWGQNEKNDLADFTAGVSYRLGEWESSMDLLFRADFISFSGKDKNPLKLSILPVVIFPDARSGFPLYFGGGAGLGIFFKQFEDESALSFDYQIFGGARMMNVIGTTGFSLEVGMKNHIHLLSDGQHNGVYVSVGTVFEF